MHDSMRAVNHRVPGGADRRLARHHRPAQLLRLPLQPRGDVDRVADGREVLLSGRTDLAQGHLAGMDTDADCKFRQPAVGVLRVHPIAKVVGDDRQAEAGLNGAKRLVFPRIIIGMRKHRHDAVTDEFHDPAAGRDDRLAGALKVGIE